MTRCENCRGIPARHQFYFANYVMHVLAMNPGELVPIFCGEQCMIEYVARMKRLTLKQVRMDFKKFCGEGGDELMQCDWEGCEKESRYKVLVKKGDDNDIVRQVCEEHKEEVEVDADEHGWKTETLNN